MFKVVACLALGFSLSANADVKPIPDFATLTDQSAPDTAESAEADEMAEDIEPMDEMDLEDPDENEWQAEIQEAQWGRSLWTCRVQNRHGGRFMARSTNRNQARRSAMSQCARVSNSCRLMSCRDSSCSGRHCW